MALATVRVAAARANGHTIRREEIETRVLEEIEHKLVAPMSPRKHHDATTSNR